MRNIVISALLFALSLGVVWGAEKGDYLSDDETDQLREAQDPSQRIEKYLSFAQVRLERFDDYRNRPANPDYDIPGYLEKELDEYIRITDALKDWIEDHFDRRDDMRVGLKKIMEEGPHQLDQLRRIEDSPDRYAAGYSKSLNDAIEDFSDMVDGASKALSEQSKLFGELKREQKVDAQEVKDREKEEKKRTKGEDKLRKKEHEKGPPTDKDED
jgi:hypothetical protein